MTIAAAYLISEGVVFGADSTTTVLVKSGDGGDQNAAQLLNHAQKLFEVGSPERGRFGLCTWGAGAVGRISHRTIIARLGDKVTQKTSVIEAANLLVGLVSEELSRQGVTQSGKFGYFFGGIDPITHLPACLLLEFEGGGVKVVPLNIGQAVFQGSPQFFGRTFHGYDPRLRENLLRELQARIGDSVAGLNDIYQASFETAASGLSAVGFTDLPIREAIDFVHTYLHITVKAYKFKYGPPTCGGPLEIGFVSTDRPFRWVRHKPFDAALLEPETGSL